jgi:membrane protease YdiL (CAAX protease family)
MSTGMITSAMESQKAPRSSWLSRHPMWGYGLLAYGITYGILFGAILAIQGGVLQPDGALGFVLNQVSAAGPALAALIVIAATQGRQGVGDLLRRLVQWRVGVQWYMIAFVVIPLLTLTGYGITSGTPIFRVLLQNWPLYFTFFLPWVARIAIETGLAEEPGWRGFALPRIQAKHGPLLGSLFLGLFWALWHLPNIVFGGQPLSFFGLEVVAAMVNTYVFTWVYNHTRGSLFIAMLLHATINGSSYLVSRLVGAGDLQFMIQLYTGVILANGIFMLLVTLLSRGPLGYQPEGGTA